MRFASIATAAAIALLCVLSLGSASATGAVTHAWAQDGFDAGNTGFNPNETTITQSTVAALENRWSITSLAILSPCRRQEPPVVAGGRLFLADEGGFAAYNAAVGNRLWTVRFSRPDEEGVDQMAVVGSTLIVSTVEGCTSVSDQTGKLTAYDVASGAVLWSVSRSQPFYSIVTDDGVVVGSGGSGGPTETGAYRVSDGHLLWQAPDNFASSAVSAAGRVLLSTDTGSEAVDMVTGAVEWTTTNFWTALAATPDGTRFIVTNGVVPVDLVAVSVANGSVAWTRPGVAGTVAVDGSQVYDLHQSRLDVFASSNGVPTWSATVQVDARRGERPIVAGGVVYVVNGGYVDGFNSATGAALGFGAFEQETGHVVVENGRLYVTTGRILDEYSP